MWFHFNFSECVMLLFEHKQYLQSYDAESSMQTEILSFKIMAVKAEQSLQLRLVGTTTSNFPDCWHHNPEIYITLPSGTSNKGGGAMLRCFREEDELLSCRQNYSMSMKTILMDSQVSNQCSKAVVFHPVPRVPLLCISLSFRSSARQLLQWNCVPIIHFMCKNRQKFFTVTRSVKHGGACGCRGNTEARAILAGKHFLLLQKCYNAIMYSAVLKL